MGAKTSVAFIILFSVYLAFYINVKADTNLRAQKHKHKSVHKSHIDTIIL